MSKFLRAVFDLLCKYKYHSIAGVLIFFWCLSYFTTGDKLEWGDFSFFSQAYEAMRTSILHYHQFPWFNPWVSGGVPLYANPQMGVFSIQMLTVLVFGAPLGLKIAIAIYTALGYASAYLLLRKYFKIDSYIATALSVLWIFCSFFVAHLPAHFTFVWYMLAPLFIYLALTLKNWKSGLLFGGAFAIMAQSQIHNPFMHLSLICGVILLCRLIFAKTNRKDYLLGLASAAGIFLVLAGHRLLMTFQNAHQFPRHVEDLAPSLTTAFLGPILPLSYTHPFTLFDYPKHPLAPHNYNEVTATIGIFALIAGLICLLFFVYQIYANGFQKARQQFRKQYLLPSAVLAAATLCYSLGFGRFAVFAPYNLLKHLPIFSDMRVSPRWFIFFNLGLLIFIGIVASRAPKRSFMRFATMTLLTIGVLEMFFLNVGYPARILSRTPVDSPKPSYQYPFVQTSYFGQTKQLSDGSTLPDDGNMPKAYREYEATRHNEGILYANDALVELALSPYRRPGHPTCPVEEGCNFVRSNNATVEYWSPNRIMLKRTAPGPIQLNMNNSSYFKINGKRNYDIRVAEPFTDFIINEPDSAQTITIEAQPSLIGTAWHKLRKAL